MGQGIAHVGPEASKCCKVLQIWGWRLQRVVRYCKFVAGGWNMVQGIANSGPEVSKSGKVLQILGRRLEHTERYCKFGAGCFEML